MTSVELAPGTKVVANRQKHGRSVGTCKKRKEKLTWSVKGYISKHWTGYQEPYLEGPVREMFVDSPAKWSERTTVDANSCFGFSCLAFSVWTTFKNLAENAGSLCSVTCSVFYKARTSVEGKLHNRLNLFSAVFLISLFGRSPPRLHLFFFWSWKLPFTERRLFVSLFFFCFTEK